MKTMPYKLNDKAYRQHYHAVAVTDDLLSEEGFIHPSQLISVGDNEYRTMFVSLRKGVALFVTTQMSDTENFSIYMCSTRDAEKYMRAPLNEIPGKKMRFKEIAGLPKGSADREQSIKLSLIKLEILPPPQEKKKVEDISVKNADGTRTIDYSKINKFKQPA